MDKSSSSNMQANSTSSIFSSNSLKKYCSTSLANLQKLMLPRNYIDEKVLHGHRMDTLANDIEGAVLKLTRSWNLYIDNFPDRVKNADVTFEKLLRLTAKAVFHGKFTKTVSSLTKGKLKDSVTSCGFKMENNSPHMIVCITFSQIIDEPWTKFVSTHHSSLTCEEMEEIWDQEGWILLEERLDILLSQKMIDHAAIILEVCIMKGRQWHRSRSGNSVETSETFNPFYFSFEKFVQFMIIYVFLWNRNPNKYKAFDMWTSQMFQEVIKVLLLREDERKESRLFPKLKDWKKSKKIALPFLETAIWYLLKCEGSNLDTLEGLIEFWIGNVPINEEDATENPVVSSILNRINEVSSSAYIYLLGDMVKKNKVGLKEDIVNAKFVEIYVRAMSIDMERIEVQKSMKVADKEKVVELQKELSKNFVKIADVFKRHPATSFQFLLTAHCLHPQDSLYQRLFPESLSDPETEEQPSSVPKCIDSPEVLQLPSTLCEDLTTVINNPRWKAICGWTSREELKQLCRELVNTGGDLLIKEKELEFINIDYDKFKNLKPAIDPDDDGIEKGYGYGEKRKPRKVHSITSFTSLVPKRKPGRKKRIGTNLEGLENKAVKIKTVKRAFIRKIGNSLTRTLKKTKEAHSKYVVPSIASKNLRTKLIANKYNNIYNRKRLLAYKDMNINNNFRRPLPKRIPKKSQAPKFLPSGYEILDGVVPFNISDPSNPIRVTRSQTRTYSSKLSISIAERRSEDQISINPENPPDFKTFDKIFTFDESCKLSSYRCKEPLNPEISGEVTVRSSYLPPLQNENAMDVEDNWRKKLSAKNLRRMTCHPKVNLDPEPLINVELVKLARESMELMSVICRFGLFPETNTPNPRPLSATECNLQNELRTEIVKNTQYYRPAPKSVKMKEQRRMKREMLEDCQERLSYFVESKRRALHSLIQLPEVPAFTNPINDTPCSSQLVEENILQDLQIGTSFEHPQLSPPLSNVGGIQVTCVTNPLENNSAVAATLDTPIPIPLTSFNHDFQTVCDTSTITYAQSSCQTSGIQSNHVDSNHLYANPRNEFPHPYPYNPNFKSDKANETISPEKVQYKNFENSQIPCNDLVFNQQHAYGHEHFGPDFSAENSGFVLNHENGMFCREESATHYFEKGDISLQVPEYGSKNHMDKSDLCRSSQLCPEHVAQTVSSIVSNPDFLNASSYMPPKEESLDLSKPIGQSNTILAVPAPKRRKVKKRPTEESVMATIDSVVESNGFNAACDEAEVVAHINPLEDVQKSYQNGLPSDFNAIHNGEYLPTKSNMLENSLCDSDYLSKMKSSAPAITSLADHHNENDYLSTAVDLSTNDHPVGDVAKQLQEIIESVPVLKDPFHLPQKCIPEMPTEAFNRQQEGILPGLSGDTLNADPSDISAMEVLLPTSLKMKGESSNILQHSDAGTYCNLQVDDEENKQEIPPAPIYTDTAAVAALCDIPKDIEKDNFISLPSRKIRKQPELTRIQELLRVCKKEIRVRILPCDSPIQKNPFLVPRPILQMRNEEAYSASDVDDVIIIDDEVNSEDIKTRELTKQKSSSTTSNEVSKIRSDSMEKSKSVENQSKNENEDEIQVLGEIKSKTSLRPTKRRTTNGRSRILHHTDFKNGRRISNCGVTRIIKKTLQLNGVNKIDSHKSEDLIHEDEMESIRIEVNNVSKLENPNKFSFSDGNIDNVRSKNVQDVSFGDNLVILENSSGKVSKEDIQHWDAENRETNNDTNAKCKEETKNTEATNEVFQIDDENALLTTYKITAAAEAKSKVVSVGDTKKELISLTGSKNEFVSVADAENEFPSVAVAENEFVSIAEAENEFPSVAVAENEFASVAEVQNDFVSVAEAENEFVSVAEAENEFVSIAEAENEFVSTADAENEFVSIAEAENEFVSIAEAENEFVSIAEAENEFVSIAEAENEFISVVEAENEFASVAEAENEFVSVAQAENEFASVAEVQNDFVSVAEAENDFVSVAEAENEFVSVAEAENGFISVTEAKNEFASVAEVQNDFVSVAEAEAENDFVSVAEAEKEIISVAEVEKNLLSVTEAENVSVPIADADNEDVSLAGTENEGGTVAGSEDEAISLAELENDIESVAGSKNDVLANAEHENVYLTNDENKAVPLDKAGFLANTENESLFLVNCENKFESVADAENEVFLGEPKSGVTPVNVGEDVFEAANMTENALKQVIDIGIDDIEPTTTSENVFEPISISEKSMEPITANEKVIIEQITVTENKSERVTVGEECIGYPVPFAEYKGAQVKVSKNIVEPETVPKIEVGSETVPQIQVESETVPRIEVESETVPRIEVESETVPQIQDEAETVPQIEVESETVPQIQVEPETIPQIQVEPERVPQIQVEAETVPQIEVESETVPQIQVEPETIPQIQVEPERVPQIEVEPETVPQIEVEPEKVSKIEVEPGIISRNTIELKIALKFEVEPKAVFENKSESIQISENQVEPEAVFENKSESIEIEENQVEPETVFGNKSESIQIGENQVEPETVFGNKSESIQIGENQVDPEIVFENKSESIQIGENQVEPEAVFENKSESIAIIKPIIVTVNKVETLAINENDCNLVPNAKFEQITISNSVIEVETVSKTEIEPESVPKIEVGRETVTKETGSIQMNKNNVESGANFENEMEFVLGNGAKLIQNEVKSFQSINNEVGQSLIVKNEVEPILNAKNEVQQELIVEEKVNSVQIAEHEPSQCGGSPIGNTDTSNSSDRCTNNIRNTRKLNCRFLSSSQKLKNGSTTYTSSKSQNDEQRQRLMMELSDSLKLDVSSPPAKRSKRHRNVKANKIVHSTPSSTYESSSDEDCLPRLVHISPLRNRLKTSTDEDDSPPTLDLYLSK